MRFFRTTLGLGAALAAAAVLSACGGGTSTSTSTTTAASPAAMAGAAKAGGAMKGGAKAGGAMKGGAMKAGSISVTLGALNGSKQSGTASITGKGSGVQVMVSVMNEPKAASEPSHIHQGTCPKPNPAVWKPLTNVMNGKATSMVAGVTVAQLKKGPYAIVVHKSLKEIATYVSCGDIK